MISLNKYDPIFITGVERSGSTFIARILDMCGVWSGDCNKMFENKLFVEINNEFISQYEFGMPDSSNLMIPTFWKNKVEEILGNQKNTSKPWMIKHSGLAKLWPIWNFAYPDAKWLIVRRRTGDVIQSCCKTGYMKLFKDQNVLKQFGFVNEEEGWLWWIHQYEYKFVQMIQSGLNCRVVWPERMVTGDYHQIYETIQWLGLKWNDHIPEVIGPLLDNSKEV